MVFWKTILSRLAMVFVSLVIVGTGSLATDQKRTVKSGKSVSIKKGSKKRSAKKTVPTKSATKATGQKRIVAQTIAAKRVEKSQKRLKGRPSTVIGELDDETAPMADDDDSISVDKGSTALLKKGKQSKKTVKSKSKSEIDKENERVRKREEKRKKIKEGFSKAEDFHKMWYNLATEKVKVSLKNLTKFCKVACTKKECMDDEVANNCHLMCPKSTTEQCPDPLKRNKEEEEEVPIVIEKKDDDDPFPQDDKDSDLDISEDIVSSIEKGDKDIMEREG